MFQLIIGLFVGATLGLLIASLMVVARDDTPDRIRAAYKRGVEDGKKYVTRR
jgi:hypothetical protein